MTTSDLAKQFEMANKQLTLYTRRKAKEIAEEFTEEVEEVLRKFYIEPMPVTLLTWVMNFLTDLNIEFKLVTSKKMLEEVRGAIRKRGKDSRKKKVTEKRKKKQEESDVT